jgi:hypothetical protein
MFGQYSFINQKAIIKPATVSMSGKNLVDSVITSKGYHTFFSCPLLSVLQHSAHM